ncbi:AbiH family protein [Reichenbachiella sp.]|uniref:AbiH family protein n=1 Tax=Reichenbachiella sp. TaxID=2184521 RepID=UPI003B5B3E14
MNRLIIIGNGFDLAHGLPTRYSDFLLWYFKKSVEKLTKVNGQIVESKDSNMNYLVRNSIYQIIDLIKEATSIDDFLKLIKRFQSGLDPGRVKNTINYTNDLLKAMIDLENKGNWVNVENLYYTMLLQKFDEADAGKEREKFKQEVVTLNNELNKIQSLLEEYLDTLTVEIDQDLRRDFEEIFFGYHDFRAHEAIDDEEIVDGDPVRVTFLNFNYTSTLDQYLPNLPDRYEINQIHGRLKDSMNPVIFGYGDEKDKYFLELEELNENEVMSHFKSIKYFKTPNYRNLLNFLKKNFEVYVVGHNCGNSDRTLLKHIFESDKCKLIKILHHKNMDNYIEVVKNIARHFDDKLMLREKVLHFKDSDFCPQVR